MSKAFEVKSRVTAVIPRLTTCRAFGLHETSSILAGSEGLNREANRLKVLGIKAIGRRVEEQRNDQSVLREEPAAYNSGFDLQKRLLSMKNSCLWGVKL